MVLLLDTDGVVHREPWSALRAMLSRTPPLPSEGEGQS